MTVFLKSAKILIVDDEPLNIEVLAKILEHDGEILFATDGETALTLCRRERPDIVLLDVKMPGIDGFEVCRRLKEHPETQDIAVVFVTTRTDEFEEEKGILLGAVDYVGKPINAAIVRARIRNHLELARYRSYLAEMAFVDGLTGVPNRRKFDDHLVTEWQRAKRTEAWVSVLLMDIDYFKKYNDTYGHQLGDDCLRDIASAMSGLLRRPADLFARYGGEEFVSVLPETDGDGAMSIGAAFNLAVNSLERPHSASEIARHVTISIGVASRRAVKGLEPEDLVEIADRNLYRAKEQGRNRVVGDA